uniref:glutathione transferase n=1 Tax=Nyssomyia neivai TaxID=330878 RepID=A0A1L8E4G0_9DIPT
MAPIKFYHLPMGPPSRGVLLTIRNLNLDVEIIEVDLLKGENLTAQYLEMNPQHTIPTINDNGLFLGESKAICTYLVNSKDPGNPLYPTDPAVRALVDARLYFDAATIFPRMRAIFAPILFFGAKAIEEEKKQAFYHALEIMNTFLEGRIWFAADHPTLADLALLASFSTFMYCGADVDKYKNILAWYKRCESLTGFDENEVGAKILGGMIKGKLGITDIWP